jgi:hypothetical protein
MLSAPWWLGLLYVGPQWSPAPIYLAILCPLTLLQMLVSPKVDFLFVVGSETGVFWFDVMRIVLSMLVALSLVFFPHPTFVLGAYVLVAVALFWRLSERVAKVIGEPLAARSPS